MPQALVLGGTGFVGRHVCEKLERAGWSVTVPTRRAVNAAAVQHLPRLTVIEADVHDPVALTRLLPGHDAVVNLVAILHGSEAAFERTHVELPRKIAAACLASDVRRLVHISALGVADDGPAMYQRSKARGEALLRAAAGLNLTVLRPSVIFGAGDRFLNLFAQLQAVFPVMPLAGASARFQPVWVEDVASAVVRCLQDAATVGRTFDCAGPDVLTLAELVRLAGRHGSRARPVLPLPMALGRLQARVMELAPGEPLMSRDNLDAMRVDNVATGQHPGLAALGIAPASVRAIAPTYLGRRGVRSGLLLARARPRR
ncbi:complex I NDUFA9 subunit family protein [Hydrogenophaga sp.]|uniref:complex I NDUFA9 subunit family protein n=1 Tax=Hydrogenophaga sp. TaxID=1904254 RepID=UPI00286E6ED6|nr:complex I NDUFA9 subunit family protein [Hydrogenophaga sp.]